MAHTKNPCLVCNRESSVNALVNFPNERNELFDRQECHDQRQAELTNDQRRRGRTPRDPAGRAKRVHVGLTHAAHEELTTRAIAAGCSASLMAARILEPELVPCPE